MNNKLCHSVGSLYRFWVVTNREVLPYILSNESAWVLAPSLEWYQVTSSFSTVNVGYEISQPNLWFLLSYVSLDLLKETRCIDLQIDPASKIIPALHLALGDPVTLKQRPHGQLSSKENKS
jgi:hypothetical protein